MTPPRPTLLFAMDPAQIARVLPPDPPRRMDELYTVLDAAPMRSWTTGRAAELLPQTEILVTGWGGPPIGPEVLERAPRLRLIAHTAGSVKRLLADAEFFKRGIAVTTAADAKAVPVAEFTLAAILFVNKQVFRFRESYRRDRSRRVTDQLAAGPVGNLGKTAGIVGASRIGRLVIERLGGFDLDVLVFDPLLAPDDPILAKTEWVDLDTLLRRSDVVSLHAPLLETTRGMTGARELSLMQDGAMLINTARGALVDHGGIRDFDHVSEQYYMHVDPAVEVLAETTFSGAHDPWRQDVTMPVAFKTQHRAGRIFHTSLGHTADELDLPNLRPVLHRGRLWAGGAGRRRTARRPVAGHLLCGTRRAGSPGLPFMCESARRGIAETQAAATVVLFSGTERPRGKHWLSRVIVARFLCEPSTNPGSGRSSGLPIKTPDLWTAIANHHTRRERPRFAGLVSHRLRSASAASTSKRSFAAMNANVRLGL